MRHTPDGKGITLQQLNYHLYLLRLISVSLVSSFEGFMETICRKVLLRRHNLFGQFDPQRSWKQIPPSGTVDTVWESVADQVLGRLQSGRLRTYASVFRKLDVALPKSGSKEGKALEEIIQRRNVIVHNQGKPDKRYLQIVPSPSTYPSGGLQIDLSYVEGACDLLVKTARSIVERLVNKGTLEAGELIVTQDRPASS